MKHIFRDVIKRSRVLTREQKELLIADPQLPTEYRESVVLLLTEFNERSKKREAYLRDKMNELYTEFARRMEEDGFEKKKELLEKARQQIEQFSPIASSGV